MPFIYRNLILTPGDSEESLPEILAANLAVPVTALSNVRIIRKAVDARKKQNIKLVYTLSFEADNALQKKIAVNPSVDRNRWQRYIRKSVS